MIRKIIAGTAVAGALSVGVTGLATAGGAGAAGAATPSSAGSTASRCTRLPHIEAKVHKVESKLAARLPKVQTREATLNSEGRTKKAQALATRVTKIQTHENKVNARLATAQAKCTSNGGSTSTTGTNAS